MERTKDIWISIVAHLVALLVILGVCAVTWRLGYKNGVSYMQTQIDSAPRDSVTVRDTVTIDKPVPKLVYISDTLLVPVTVRDTVRVRDTTFIALPKETRLYEKDSYRAVVSGYKPSLDEITVYPTTTTVTVKVPVPTQDTKHWGVGLIGGYGFSLSDSRVTASPFIGVGVSYSLVRW